MDPTAADARPLTFGLVIPTYNRPRFVLDAVRSALAQTRPFDRIVVVCDGPQPETEALLADLDIEVLVPQRGGVSAARNAGIAALDTDWVCFLDDDDLFVPEYLAKFEQGLAEYPLIQAANACYWVMGDAITEDADFVAHDYDAAMKSLPDAAPRRRFDYMFIYGESFDRLLERMRGSMSGSAVRRDLLIEAGAFPVGLRCAEDWTMYVNVARLTEWGTHPDPLVVFRDHDAGSSTTHGGARNGIDTLKAVASFWSPTDLPTPPHRPLSAYREDYRYILRWTLDLCRAERDRDSYREALRIARTILPRPWDRLLARVPHRVWEHWRSRKNRLASTAASIDAPGGGPRDGDTGRRG